MLILVPHYDGRFFSLTSGGKKLLRIFSAQSTDNIFLHWHHRGDWLTHLYFTLLNFVFTYSGVASWIDSRKHMLTDKLQVNFFTHPPYPIYLSKLPIEFTVLRRVFFLFVLQPDNDHDLVFLLITKSAGSHPAKCKLKISQLWDQ